MPKDEMVMVRNTSRETSVRHGWRKKSAINGAQKKRMEYITTETSTLKVKTEL